MILLSAITISIQNAIDICKIRPNDFAPFWNTFQILIPMELILERLSLIDLSLAYFLSDQPGNGFFTLDTRRKARDCFKITFFSIFLCPQSPVFGPSFSHERVRLMSGKLLFMSG